LLLKLPKKLGIYLVQQLAPMGKQLGESRLGQALEALDLLKLKIQSRQTSQLSEVLAAIGAKWKDDKKPRVAATWRDRLVDLGKLYSKDLDDSKVEKLLAIYPALVLIEWQPPELIESLLQEQRRKSSKLRTDDSGHSEARKGIRTKDRFLIEEQIALAQQIGFGEYLRKRSRNSSTAEWLSIELAMLGKFAKELESRVESARIQGMTPTSYNFLMFTHPEDKGIKNAPAIKIDSALGEILKEGMTVRELRSLESRLLDEWVAEWLSNSDFKDNSESNKPRLAKSTQDSLELDQNYRPCSAQS
jgi:hypothetical protein